MGKIEWCFIGKTRRGEGEGDPTPGDPPAWTAQLPDEYKGNETLTQFGNLGEFAKAHLDTLGKVTEYESKVGEMLPRLGENPTEDDLKAYREAYGIPGDPEGYKVERPNWDQEKLGPYPEDLEKSFLKFAHDRNFSPDQVQAAYSWYIDNVMDSAEGIQRTSEERKAEAVKALQDTWGDEYEANADIAMRAVWFFADEETVNWLDNSGFGDNPNIIKLFYHVGTQLLNDKMLRDVRPPREKVGEATRDSLGQPSLSYPSMDKKD